MSQHFKLVKFVLHLVRVKVKVKVKDIQGQGQDQRSFKVKYCKLKGQIFKLL